MSAAVAAPGLVGLRSASLRPDPSVDRPPAREEAPAHP
jgi:hypothetical protein